MKSYLEIFAGKAIRINLCFVIVAVVAVAASASNFVVSNTNDSGAGSLRDAINQANANGQEDLITFDPVVFSSPQTITLTGGELRITREGTNFPGIPVTVQGPGANLLTISGGGASRVFYFDNEAVVTISGLTVSGGNGTGSTSSFDGRGGGIFANSSHTITLRDLKITNNNANLGGGLNLTNSRNIHVSGLQITNNSVSGQSAQGGGYYSTDSGLAQVATITDTTISGNTTSQDVAGASFNAVNLTITDLTVDANNYSGPSDQSAGAVGGIRMISANGLLSDSHVTNNTGRNSAGGIEVTTSGTLLIRSTTVSGNTAAGITGGTGCGINRNSGGVGTVTIVGSAILDNQCQDTLPAVQEVHSGGGIATIGSNAMNIINSTISGNSTHNGASGSGRGGGIWNNSTTMRIINSTITGNFSASNGGTGVGHPQLTPSVTTIVQNTIIANNNNGTSSDVSGDNFTSSGHNLVRNNPAGTGFGVAGDIIGVDPLLAAGGPQDNGGPTKTVALLAGSPAINNGSNALAVDQNGFRLRFDQRGGCFFRVVGNTVDIGAFETDAVQRSGKNADFDFDGDCRTDVSIFRPSVGEWWYLRSSDGGNNAFQFGTGSDAPAAADFTGDGITDVAFWRPSSGEWFILRSEDHSYYSFPFGTSGDIPVPGDYDGDGKAEAAIFRPSTGVWYLSTSSGASVVPFGALGDLPVVGDYDGDGRDDVAIYRSSNSQWWINRSTAGVIVYQFGASDDLLVPSDYTGDGKTDVAIWRPSSGVWFILRSEDSSYYSFPFGAPGDVPVPGDYDGDGQCDAAIFRPASNTWFLNGSTSGVQIFGFGSSGDAPLPGVIPQP